MATRLVVGVEIHARIRSQTKLFSQASALARDAETGRPPAPNSLVGWLDCALPGAMPRLNQHCVDQAVATGLALGGAVQGWSLFERKHYFYCDSPLGYQITQQSYPIVLGGMVHLSNGRKVRLARIQLEQDTAKSFHGPYFTLVDFNRAGVGLMEIVSEPDMSDGTEAAEYVRLVQRLLRHIGTCDGNMEDGSLRADVNVSIEADGRRSHRVEVKNLNSIRSVERAIRFEQMRLEQLLKEKRLLGDDSSDRNETRSFDAKSGETVSMREKESGVDYRFMVEPDLPPLIVAPERIAKIQQQMNELPDQARKRFANEFGLRQAEIDIFLLNPSLSSYFEAVVAESKAPPTLIANFLCNTLLGALRREGLEDDPFITVDPNDFRELIDRVHAKQIPTQRAKDLINDKMVKQEKIDWSSFSVAQGLTIQQSGSINIVCEQVLDEFPNEVTKYKEGKHTLFNFFFGKAFGKLKASGADVDEVRMAMEAVLKKRVSK